MNKILYSSTLYSLSDYAPCLLNRGICKRVGRPFCLFKYCWQIRVINFAKKNVYLINFWNRILCLHVDTSGYFKNLNVALMPVRKRLKSNKDLPKSIRKIILFFNSINLCPKIINISYFFILKALTSNKRLAFWTTKNYPYFFFNFIHVKHVFFFSFILHFFLFEVLVVNQFACKVFFFSFFFTKKIQSKLEFLIIFGINASR